MPVKSVSFSYAGAEATVNFDSSDEQSDAVPALTPDACNLLKDVSFIVRVNAWIEMADITANQSIAPQNHQAAGQEAAKAAAREAVRPAAYDIISAAVKNMFCPSSCRTFPFHHGLPTSRIELTDATEVNDWGENTVYCHGAQRWKLYYGCNGALSQFAEMVGAFQDALTPAQQDDDGAKGEKIKLEKAGAKGFKLITDKKSKKTRFVFSPKFASDIELFKLAPVAVSTPIQDDTGNYVPGLSFAVAAMHLQCARGNVIDDLAGEVLGKGRHQVGNLALSPGPETRRRPDESAACGKRRIRHKTGRFLKWRTAQRRARADPSTTAVRPDA